MSATLQLLVNTSVASDVTLPERQPLTLTRNFSWVVMFCVATLLAAPFVIAWTASIVLT